MATLTETAVVARKIIRYTIYGLIFIIVARYSYLIASRLYRSIFPEAPPPPKVCWGKLPKIEFPQKPIYENLTFILETPDLSLPELPVQANVYFMPKSSSTIQSFEKAKQKARSLGFDPEGRKLSDTVYLYEKVGTTPSTLTMNIITNVFSISYDLAADEKIILGKPPVPQSAINAAKSYISKAGLLPEDLSGPQEHELIKIENGKFVGAIALSEADMVKVNLYRKDYNKIPAKTPTPDEANIWFIIGPTSGRGGSNVLAGEYHYFPIDETSGCTYPLITAQDAWDQFKTGKAYIASLGNNSEDAEIKIRRIYLAYYDSDNYQEFYQPIIVFEGDNKFVAYVSAVSSEYYNSEEQAEK